MSLAPGARFGRYRIEAVLGGGGQSTVYRAVDTATRIELAMKVLAPEVSADPTFRARFAREAEAVRRLDHPGIVTLYEAGEIDGQAYLAMRLVDGGTLEDAIRAEGGLEPRRAVAILGQVAAALDHAHAQGMVHRDVKPANVLLGAEDRAFLSDFGLAKLTEAARLTRSGVWVGTVEYIAPEQIMARDVGPPADVYALTAVAYETLTGRPPFVREHPADLLQAHLGEAPPPPSSLRRSLLALDPIIGRGLAKRPEDRYASAGALAHALTGAVAAMGAP